MAHKKGRATPQVADETGASRIGGAVWGKAGAKTRTLDGTY
jgi:hypothetical protein